jgi:MinD-like ATPase involved in chromosome partitioning or flagellar assembly
MRDSDRGHNLETMIRTATLDRCMVIAVVSPKGGAGKTTVTALLGMLFAELRRDPVLALDANPDFGNLADKLAPPDRAGMCTDELARWLQSRPATPAELAARLGTGPHGLRFLPTPVGDLDRMVATADVALYRDLIARLRDYQGIILVDCGTGLLDPPVRAALDTADQILLVTDSSADTAGLVVTAAQHLPAGTPTWLIANKMPARGAMVDLDRVTQAIPQLRGVTVIPEQRLTENILTPTFDWAHGPGPWQEPLREIAARLADTWHSLDRSPGQRLAGVAGARLPVIPSPVDWRSGA